MSGRLLASYLSLAAVVLVLFEVPLGVAHARGERSTLTRALERSAVSVGALAEDTMQSGSDPAALRLLAARYADEEDGTVVIVAHDGRVLAGRTAGDRSGLAAARAGHVATGTAHGRLFAAVPVSSNGVVHGAVRVTTPVEELDSNVRSYWLRLAGIAAAVFAVVALMGWLLARSVSQPLRELETAVARAGGGDLGARAPERRGPPEVRALARAFNDMASRLDVLLRAQEEFVADASHQLRTPLTALRLRVENGDVGGALAETERLGELVDALLALTRSEAAPAESVDLAAAVRTRLDAWRPAADEHGIRLEADVHGAAQVNAGRLAQVLDNLLANALAVAPRGSVLRVHGAPDALHVTDEGPGMTAEERERAFDRFWSGHGGSGLGLPIATRLLAADGGALDLQDAPDGGLDVVVRLRRA